MHSVSTRLAVLFFLVLIPVSCLAGLLAWQEDVAASQIVVTKATRLAAAARSARLATMASTVGRTAAALDAAPTEGCPGLLATALRFQPQIGGYSVVGGGVPPCHAGETGAIGAGGHAVAAPLRDGGRLLGFPVASPAFAAGDGRPPGLRSWVIGPDGTHPDVPGSTAAELPREDRLDALRHARIRGGTWPDRAGDLRSYAAEPLSGGGLLLASVAMAPTLRSARRDFAVHVAEIVVLLLLGLVAVAAMTEYAVTRPLRRLADAVGRWRLEGAFRPRPTRFVPTELAALSDAFARAGAALEAQERQLRGALARQDALLHEIHHRVKNNLQIVASLLNLQGSRITQPEARAEFGSARDRVRALATLHRHLYAHGELGTVDMQSFLVELGGQMFQGVGEVPGRRIRLEVEAPDVEITGDQAAPLALLVTEAVSNALKHGFPDGRQGCIRIALAERGALALLTISDDGVGLCRQEAGATKGLGQQLMRGFARQLGGTLRPLEGDGTGYALEFRLTPPASPEEQARRAAQGISQAGASPAGVAQGLASVD